MTATEIIEKYEVPQEFHEAIFEAYIEDSKRGFIEGAIDTYNKEIN
jgi:hypothetical protein